MKSTLFEVVVFLCAKNKLSFSVRLSLSWGIIVFTFYQTGLVNEPDGPSQFFTVKSVIDIFFQL